MPRPHTLQGYQQPWFTLQDKPICDFRNEGFLITVQFKFREIIGK